MPSTALVLAALFVAGTTSASANDSLHDDATAVRRVLVIGDSHATTSFGRALDLLLRSVDGVDVTTIGSCGVTPDAFMDGRQARCGFLSIESAPRDLASGTTDAGDWVVVAKRSGPTPKLQELLAKARPELTIVELGANQIHSAWKDPEKASTEISALADAVRASGSACLWVGPPAGRAAVKPPERIDRVYELLQQSLAGKCALLDSRPAALPFLDYERVAPRRGDGRHWDKIGPEGQALAGRWALEVFKAARRMLDGKAIATTTTASLAAPPTSDAAPQASDAAPDTAWQHVAAARMGRIDAAAP